jgi:hypothetical protein
VPIPGSEYFIEKIADLLAMPGGVDADFEIPSFSRDLARPADLRPLQIIFL